jgi:hypothetical protein
MKPSEVKTKEQGLDANADFWIRHLMEQFRVTMSLKGVDPGESIELHLNGYLEKEQKFTEELAFTIRKMKKVFEELGWENVECDFVPANYTLTHPTGNYIKLKITRPKENK